MTGSRYAAASQEIARYQFGGIGYHSQRRLLTGKP